MSNERKTEGIVRKHFEKDIGIKIEEQQSDIPQIQKPLKKASKSGDGKGSPEFIITSKKYLDYVVVVECKADTKKHKSKGLDKPKDYALDGAIHYGKYLASAYNVIAVGVSGETKKELRVSTRFIPKGGVGPAPGREPDGSDVLVCFADYVRAMINDPLTREIRHKELMTVTSAVHNHIRDNAQVSEPEKPLLISGILLALYSDRFRKGYTAEKSPAELANYLYETIESVLRKAKLPPDKVSKIMYPYEFIKHKTELQEGSALLETIEMLDRRVRPFIDDYKDIDVLGKFYGEFIRYVGGDKKGLGIVLTPKHITSLFVKLSKLNKDSIVLDTCCGTGGFLIAAMDEMTKQARGNTIKEDNIRKNQLVGVEQQAYMFALAASNMLLRGDGKANLYNSSCFKITEKLKKHKPTVILMNPPYSQKKGKKELEFVKHGLDCLEPNGILVVVVPTSCAISDTREKEAILKDHTLEAVMTLPPTLFQKVGTNPCIMVFRAYTSHAVSDTPTWLARWTDDGHEVRKNQGRVDTGKWKEIEKAWLEAYRKKEQKPGQSILKKVSAQDEWLAEAYIETDYSNITHKLFISHMANSLLAKSTVGETVEHIVGLSGWEAPTASKDPTPQLEPTQWRKFDYTELFTIQRGTIGSIRQYDRGTSPVVTASATNNGVSAYIDKSTDFTGNRITVANNGDVGEAFYQEQPFCATADVNILTSKSCLNKYTAAFICSIIRLEKPRFNYGRKWGLERMKKSTIKLPVKKDGTPDWELMERYIKTLPFSGRL